MKLIWGLIITSQSNLTLEMALVPSRSNNPSIVKLAIIFNSEKKWHNVVLFEEEVCELEKNCPKANRLKIYASLRIELKEVWMSFSFKFGSFKRHDEEITVNW